MNQEELLKMLNNTPITIDVELIKNNIAHYEDEANRYAGFVKEGMKLKRFKTTKDPLSESAIMEYVTQKLVTRRELNEVFGKRINYRIFEKWFTNPSKDQGSDHYGDEVTLYYFYYYKVKREKQRLESILKHVIDGKIQPTFNINSAGILYTSKPAIQFSPRELEGLFNCKSFTMKSLDDVAKAVANKKGNSTILAVINTTVYFTNGKEEEETLKQQAEIDQLIEESPYIPLNTWIGHENEKMIIVIPDTSLFISEPLNTENVAKIKEHTFKDLASKFLKI